MYLGSVLVLGWGSRAEVDKCLCGFVWIIIRVPCGWATAHTFVLLYACVLSVRALSGRMCYNSRTIVPTSPHTLPSSPHLQGVGSKQGQIALCCSCSWRWPVESKVTVTGLVKNKARLLEKPTKPVPAAVLCSAMSHSAATLLTTPLKMTNVLINCYPKLATTAWCSWSSVPCPSSSAGFCHSFNNHLLRASQFSFTVGLILVIIKVRSWFRAGKKRFTYFRVKCFLFRVQHK